ncbi:MAG: helix-turn-helix transcriptional regulator [Xanthobacteraceae bacterium]
MLKAAGDKQINPTWLRGISRQLPPLSDELPPTPPPRLLDKRSVLAITGTSYPTLWSWMRAGTFPRSREVGGRSMWLSSEIDAWIAALPVRKLKGDAEVA